MKPDVVKVILLNECSFFDSNGFDNDISRYVTLMEQKQYKEACSLYEKRLVPRYPNELTRIRIIRYYRKGDTRFKEIYAGAVRDIFEKIVATVKKLIHHIASIFEGQNNNPYEVLKKIDLALRVIPATKAEGLPFVEKLGTYSVLLNYMPEEFSIALDILKRYFDNTLFVKVKIEEKPKNIRPKDIYPKEEKKKVTIDLGKIVFSDEETRMICINSDIKPKSFQVLAYCKLYWRQIFNHELERKIFLYSQKYGTKHFKIFQIIKNCRIRKMTDEVILLEVYSILSSVYQYNMKEDAFMQQAWRKVKPVDTPEAETPVVSKKDDENKKHVKKIESKKVRSEKKASAEKIKSVEVKVASEKKIIPEEKEKDKEQEEAEVQRLRDIRYKTDVQIYSLHDRIQKLCIPDIFNAHNEFDEVLPKHLDKYLVKHWKQGFKKDPYLLKGAMHIITTFLTENYNTVSPDWGKSLSNTEVMNIGFEVPELEPMIKLCIEEIRIRRAAA